MDLIAKQVIRYYSFAFIHHLRGFGTPDFCQILKSKHVLETEGKYLQYETEFMRKFASLGLVYILSSKR